jgi:hypothetical protein
MIIVPVVPDEGNVAVGTGDGSLVGEIAVGVGGCVGTAVATGAVVEVAGADCVGAAVAVASGVSVGTRVGRLVLVGRDVGILVEVGSSVAAVISFALELPPASATSSTVAAAISAVDAGSVGDSAGLGERMAIGTLRIQQANKRLVPTKIILLRPPLLLNWPIHQSVKRRT